MEPGRQCQLVRGDTWVNLRATPYDLLADGWTSSGNNLEMKIKVSATTWTEMDRYVKTLQTMVSQGTAFEQSGMGRALWVYTKFDDDLVTVAEIGATWKRKRVRGGSVVAGQTMVAPRSVVQLLTLSLEVDDVWRRAAPEPVLELLSGTIAQRSDGGISATAVITATSVYARRIAWTSATGLSGRWFWSYASTGSDVLNVLKLSANFALYWSGSASRFYFVDDSGTTRAQSGAQSFSSGQEVEICFSVTASSALLYINGVQAFSYSGTVTWPTLPDSYRIWEPTGTATANLLSLQIWPTNLGGTQMAAMAAVGRPVAELAFSMTPSNPVKNTDATWRIWNVPGSEPAQMQAVIRGVTTNYDQVSVGVRAGLVPKPATGGPTVKFECEAGTLGTNTASTADASASAGNVARFTPANTSWAARTTLALCADAVHLAPYSGSWRLMLEAKDNASSVQVNVIRWRLVIAGIAGAYSDEYSLPAVTTRCLVDLGELYMPPGAWPEGWEASTGTEYSGTFAALEIDAKNTIGSGGGTLDLDAMYLMPADLELVAGVTSWTVSGQDVLLDYASDPPAPVIVWDWRTLEFAGWLDHEGSVLELPPASNNVNDGAMVWLYVYRAIATSEAQPNDELFAWFMLRPGWRE